MPDRDAARLPEAGLKTAEALRRLRESRRSLARAFSGAVLGRQWTQPREIGRVANDMLFRANPNNIMLHLAGAESSRPPRPDTGTFAATRQLERDVVWMIADLHAWPRPITGYVTGGGTESNLFSLWVARNRLASTAGRRAESPAVLLPVSAHYSFLKALDILGWRRAEWFADHGRIGWVNVGPDGRVDLTDFRRKLGHVARTARRHGLIVVATTMTSDTGRCDPVREMSSIVSEWMPRRSVHFHVDACMGGLFLPFVETSDEEPQSCRSLGTLDIDSTSIDLHKMGRVPYGAGVVLLRGHHLDSVRMPVSYLTSGMDATLSGSRSGAMAAVAWCTLQELGANGFRRQTRRCVDLATTLRQDLESTGAAEILSPSWSNYCTLRFRRTRHPAVRRIQARWVDAAARFSISPIRVLQTEGDLRELLEGGGDAGAAAEKLLVMPHIRRTHVRSFLQALGVGTGPTESM